MTENPIKAFKSDRDYFIAAIEDGELAMRPHCSCGNFLEDDYFCTQCKKQCLCTSVYCVDQETLKVVDDFINKSPSFKNFEARLLTE